MAALYATPAELLAYADGYPYTLGDAAAQTKLIEKAQGDLDSILGDYDVKESGAVAGLKLDPATLDYTEKRALSRAICAQVLYRLEMGAEHFIRPQVASSGPDFSLSEPPGHIGPQTYRELAGSGLLRNTTTARGSGRRPSWAAFAFNLD